MRSFYYSMPTILVSGTDSEIFFIQELKKLNVSNAFILTGLASAEKNGIVSKILQILDTIGVNYRIDSTCETCPSSDYINSKSLVINQSNCDIIFAIGGGSVMDASKAIALLANNLDNHADIWSYKTKNPSHAAIPIVAIPTTIGTGSEGNGTFAIYHKADNDKFVFFNLSTRPKIAWLHPDHVKTLPNRLLKLAIMDILAHILEQFFSEQDNFIWSDYALIGMTDDIINCYEKLNNWDSSVELRENVQNLSFIAMSYLFSQGKTVKWSLHHMADKIGSELMLAHSEAITHTIGAWLAIIEQNKKYEKKYKRMYETLASLRRVGLITDN